MENYDKVIKWKLSRKAFITKQNVFEKGKGFKVLEMADRNIHYSRNLNEKY